MIIGYSMFRKLLVGFLFAFSYAFQASDSESDDGISCYPHQSFTLYSALQDVRLTGRPVDEELRKAAEEKDLFMVVSIKNNKILDGLQSDLSYLEELLKDPSLVEKKRNKVVKECKCLSQQIEDYTALVELQQSRLAQRKNKNS